MFLSETWLIVLLSCFFFFNDTATTEIYTLSLHDALPIFGYHTRNHNRFHRLNNFLDRLLDGSKSRSEEHTSELQSRQYLVCRLLLEKKKNKKKKAKTPPGSSTVAVTIHVTIRVQ